MVENPSIFHEITATWSASTIFVDLSGTSLNDWDIDDHDHLLAGLGVVVVVVGLLGGVELAEMRQNSTDNGLLWSWLEREVVVVVGLGLGVEVAVVVVLGRLVELS